MKLNFYSPNKGKFRQLRIWFFRGLLCLLAFVGVWVLAYRWVNPPTTFYILHQRAVLEKPLKHEWVDMAQISPVTLRAIVAAEDADFCAHIGIDMQALRRALQEGAVRGGSTISQQTVKNVFLWQGRSWLRKSLEGLMTPLADLAWGKRRMLEIYVNMIEFDTGVFGIQAAAKHHFGVNAAALNRVQAARLASVLPNPKGYSAVNPSNARRARAAQIIAGSDYIRRDGRAACFDR